MKNYLDEFRKKHFSVSLHLFDFKKAYSEIVKERYYVQKIQSVNDVADAEAFAFKYNCNIFTISVQNDIGMIVVLRQRQEENYLFADMPMFTTLICVN